MRLLLADDDSVAIRIVAEAAKQLGFDFKSVSDGQAALDQFLLDQPPIFILDWTLPSMDGLELIQQVRQSEGAVARAVLLLTTPFDDAKRIALAQEAGVDDYLLKPLTVPELRERLSVAEARYRQREAHDRREHRMRAALERVEVISRARAEFLANMGHELRTPLNAISGMSSTLLATQLSRHQQECVEIVQSSARLLRNTINDVLDLSCADEGRLGIHAVPMDLRSIVQDATGLFQERAALKGLKLSVHYPQHVPSALVGDPVRVRQVLTHCLNNALEFTKVGGIEVIAEAERAEEDAVWMRIGVKDTGVGMSAERLSELFLDQGSRDLTQGRSRGGRGFGLQLCRELAALMDGIMGAESEVGQGSTVWLSMLMPRVEHALSMMGTPRPPEGMCRHAMVVEDNRVNQQMLARMLEREGLRVSVANNGLEALEKMQSSLPDLLLIDLVMPELDGLSATRELKKRPAAKQVAVIGMMAGEDAAVEASCLRAGMRRVLHKPIRAEDLGRIL